VGAVQLRILLKRISGIILSVALGVIFIYSGISKLHPLIETFEFTFVDAGIANWYTAPVLARLMIGLEIFVGTLLVLNYRLKKLTLPLATGLLVFFIIYLIVQIALNGNEGNCACFGERIYMSPLNAIYKNLIMLGMIIAAWFLSEGWTLRYNKLFLFCTLLVLMIVPFVANPVDYSYTSNNLNEKVNYPLQLELLYAPEDTGKVEIPKVELRKGKHVLAFLSLTCPHCRVAAKKMRLIKREDPAISIYFVLNGEKSHLKTFLNDTRAENIPYTFCAGRTFVRLASTHLPQIYYIDNGIVVRKVDYFELSQYDLEQWLNK
jgi:uncharacterized membrane protein YphA (DoxX/SURF4 family)